MCGNGRVIGFLILGIASLLLKIPRGLSRERITHFGVAQPLSKDTNAIVRCGEKPRETSRNRAIEISVSRYMATSACVLFASWSRRPELLGLAVTTRLVGEHTEMADKAKMFENIKKMGALPKDKQIGACGELAAYTYLFFAEKRKTFGT